MRRAGLAIGLGGLMLMMSIPVGMVTAAQLAGASAMAPYAGETCGSDAECQARFRAGQNAVLGWIGATVALAALGVTVGGLGVMDWRRAPRTGQPAPPPAAP